MVGELFLFSLITLLCVLQVFCNILARSTMGNNRFQIGSSHKGDKTVIKRGDKCPVSPVLNTTSDPSLHKQLVTEHVLTIEGRQLQLKKARLTLATLPHTS